MLLTCTSLASWATTSTVKIQFMRHWMLICLDYRLSFLLPRQGQGWLHWWWRRNADHGRSLRHPWIQMVRTIGAQNTIEITPKSPGMRRLMSTVSLHVAWCSPSLNSRYIEGQCQVATKASCKTFRAWVRLPPPSHWTVERRSTPSSTSATAPKASTTLSSTPNTRSVQYFNS